jgi:hypothetical protein
MENQRPGPRLARRHVPERNETAPGHVESPMTARRLAADRRRRHRRPCVQQQSLAQRHSSRRLVRCRGHNKCPSAEKGLAPGRRKMPKIPGLPAQGRPNSLRGVVQSPQHHEILHPQNRPA